MDSILALFNFYSRKDDVMGFEYSNELTEKLV
jgi:hypothetical protein